MLESLSVGTYAWNPHGDKLSVVLSRVANVVIQVDEQFKLLIPSTLRPFIENSPEFQPGQFQYAPYFQEMPEHIGVIPILGRAYDQVHVYIDESLHPNRFQFKLREITCSGTLVS
jgi:hypothetical protein